MISISVAKFSRQEDKYIVQLGNGTRHVFSSEKKCNKFLSRTTKFLTNKYNELNLIYSDVFTLYRQIYFYFDNNRHSRHADIYELRREINKLFHLVETLFEKLSFSSCHSDTNSPQFLHLIAIIEALIVISVNIKRINENKSYAATQVRAVFLINQLSGIQSAIEHYSLDKATAYDNNNQNSTLNAYKSFLKIVS